MNKDCNKILDNILMYLCKRYNSFFKPRNLKEKLIYEAKNIEKNESFSDKLSFEYEFGKAQKYLKRFPHIDTDIKGKKILDYGCGYGGISLALDKFSPELIYGIDISREGIEYAKKEAESKGIKTASFIVYDGKKVPYKDNFFDTILLYDVVEHLQDPEYTLIEIKRILKKGGSVYIITFPWCHPYGAHLWFKLTAPWTHLIFPERIVTEFIYGSPREWNKTGLNKMSIKRLNNLIKKTGFVFDFRRYESKKIFAPFKNIPFLNEFLVSLVIMKISKR